MNSHSPYIRDSGSGLPDPPAQRLASHWAMYRRPLLGRVGSDDADAGPIQFDLTELRSCRTPFVHTLTAANVWAAMLSDPTDMVSPTHRRRPRETTPHGTHHEGSPAR